MGRSDPIDGGIHERGFGARHEQTMGHQRCNALRTGLAGGASCPHQRAAGADEIIDHERARTIDIADAEVHTEATAELLKLVAGLDELPTRPGGLFLVGCGVDIAAIKPLLEEATSLTVSVPEEPETALARGAALASAEIRRCSRRRLPRWPTNETPTRVWSTRAPYPNTWTTRQVPRPSSSRASPVVAGYCWSEPRWRWPASVR